MQKLLLVVIPAIWVMAIAMISVQNATPVTIQFFGLKSVELPFGVVLSFCTAGGMVVTAGLVWLLGGQRRFR